MSKSLTILAVVLTTVLTLMLTMVLPTTAPAAPVTHITCAPDAHCAIQGDSELAGAGRVVSDSAAIALKSFEDGAPLFLGAGALLVSGIFVAAYRVIQP